MLKIFTFSIASLLSLDAFAQTIEGTSPQVYLDIREYAPAATNPTPITFKKLRNKGDAAIAVIIGHKEYDNMKNVDYAERDAELMNDLLVKSFGFKNSNIELKTNSTLTDLNSLFGNDRTSGTIKNKIVPGVTKELWVYYSGHAGPNGNDATDKTPYLMCKDTKIENVGATAYPLDLLYKKLNALKVEKVVVIIDACFSGTELPYKNSSTSVVNDPFANQLTFKQKAVVLTAADSSQFACWDEVNEHGLFTFELVKAIQSGKLADSNGDQKVSFAEIIDHLNDKKEGVPAKARKQNKTRTPTIKGGRQNDILF